MKSHAAILSVFLWVSVGGAWLATGTLLWLWDSERYEPSPLLALDAAVAYFWFLAPDSLLFWSGPDAVEGT